MKAFTIRSARPDEAGLVLEFIRKLAVYEKCADDVVVDEATIYQSLFVERSAEVVFAEEEGAAPLSDWTVQRLDERALKAFAK